MAWWTEQMLPRVTDKMCGVGEIHKLRHRVCQDLVGDVIEIGFGSGLNVGHYPAAVSSVAAVEPSAVAWRIARPRIEATRVRVTRAGLDGQRLDLESSAYDSALSTYTMCTIPDLAAALGEIVRVLRPGGRLVFLEHGLAPDPGVVKWQHRLTPIQRRVAGGCHLDRPIVEYVERSGLRIAELETLYSPGPKAYGFFYLGTAVKDGGPATRPPPHEE